MYNPYFNYPQSYPQFPQDNKPIQNIINTQMPNNNEIFMARFLKENEDYKNIYINNKTAFIDLNNNKLIIKDVDNSKPIEYEILKPRDEKDIKIEELEKQINELKGMIENDKSTNVISTDNESTSTDSNAKKLRKK